MLTDAPVREPASGSATFDDAMREPVDGPAEALIREARRRARRRRIALGAGVAAVGVAIAGIALTASFDGAPSEEPMSVPGAPAAIADLGIFAPLRGRIVWVSGGELRGVDPADPTSVATVALPDAVVSDLSPGAPVTVAGWSADGTRLALSSEYLARNYVVEANGTVWPHRSDGGCCWFVSEPWLSPDGRTVFEGADVDSVRFREVRSDASTTAVLAPTLDDGDTAFVSPAAWSPDGTRVALITLELVGTDLRPSIALVDRDTGTFREVLRGVPGHIRHVTWSPDGSSLLLIAGPWSQSTELESLNPLVHPKETGLYLVPVDRRSPAVGRLPSPIARGHFVAATWSPDGNRIAAVDFAPTNRRLVVMNADGSGSRSLAELPLDGLFTGLAWHPVPSSH